MDRIRVARGSLSFELTPPHPAATASDLPEGEGDLVERDPGGPHRLPGSQGLLQAGQELRGVGLPFHVVDHRLLDAMLPAMLQRGAKVGLAFWLTSV